MSLRNGATALLIGLAAVLPAQQQRLTSRPCPADVQVESVRPRSKAILIPMGVVGGAVGAVAGVGYGLMAHPNDITFVLTGFLGETLGVPLGVHLANGRRGKGFWMEYLGSTLVGVAGTLIVARAAGGLYYASASQAVAVPLLQATVAALIERGTTRPSPTTRAHHSQGRDSCVASGL